MLSISFAVSFELAISKIYPPMSLSRSMTFAMRSILAAQAIKNRSISSWSLALFRGNDLSSSMQTRSAASPSLFISRLAFGVNIPVSSQFVEWPLGVRTLVTLYPRLLARITASTQVRYVTSK